MNDENRAPDPHGPDQGDDAAEVVLSTLPDPDAVDVPETFRNETPTEQSIRFQQRVGSLRGPGTDPDNEDG